jgi:hypothetical protein
LSAAWPPEVCKQHQAARAAERLVWLALILARSALLGAVAPGEWPDDLPFSDDACTAQRDRLALGWDTKAFREVLAAYLQLQAIATTPPAERGDTVLFWPALARHDDRFRRPLAERLEETPHRHRAGARGRPAPRQVGLFDDEAFKRSAGGTPVLRQRAGRLSLAAREGVGPVPPELRARAAEAIARQRHITDS